MNHSKKDIETTIKKGQKNNKTKINNKLKRNRII